uniref:Uncharacterized protein n=1 Tax=Ciona savignyi TaxID=51511 RepID=H2ZI13_CIOSA
MSKAPAIGIDLGTCNLCVGVFQNGKVEIIANDQGNKTTPSYVGFTDTQWIIGDSTKNQVVTNPTNTIFDAKRLIGRGFDDEFVAIDMKYWPFAVKNDNGKPKYEVEYKRAKTTFSPEEISSMVLLKMKETAEAYLGKSVTDAVISVPAFFNDAQRRATKEAGKMAGLNVLQIMNAPTAAAVAYGIEKNVTGNKNVLIFDLGGGKLDATVVYEAKATSGDSHLGGEDFDNRLVDFLCKEFQAKYNKDLRSSKQALMRLRAACEQAKRDLSTTNPASIQINSLLDGIDFNTSVTRATFDQVNWTFFSSILLPVEKAIRDTGLSKQMIDEVILVGGSSRIPRIQRLLKEFFNGKELNKSLNPDEAVVYGAALQAALLSGDQSDIVRDLFFLDVTTFSLTLETANGTTFALLKKNSPVPRTVMQNVTTYTDNQSKVILLVFEGERLIARDNNLLGKFELSGIPPAPRGVPQIEVKFDVDADGILNVSARDKRTGNEITVT